MTEAGKTRNDHCAQIHRRPRADAHGRGSRGELLVGARPHPRGRAAGRADRLPARTLPHAIFLPARGSCASSIWPSRFPAHPPPSWPKWRAKPAWPSWHRSLSAARRGSTTTRRSRSNADGQIAGIYRKMHIPDDPLYYEKYYFAPGDLGFQAVDTAAGRVGTLVCWDQWYPEGARLTALAGRRGAVLSHGHRLAPGGEGRVRRRAV